jgi:hypothetical protein
VKPLLTPLLDGQMPTFNEKEQAMLAGWGAKVACDLLAIERKRRSVIARQS